MNEDSSLNHPFIEISVSTLYIRCVRPGRRRAESIQHSDGLHECYGFE